MSIFNRPSKVKKFGKLHRSGMNRAQRRAQAAFDRHAVSRDMAQRSKDASKKRAAATAAKVKRKHDAAHERAVRRKEAANGKTAPLLTRAKRKVQDALKARQVERNRRRERHARKMAGK